MKDNSLATRAAWLSYIGGYTQGEIAKRLNVSSVKAHRLIMQARNEGLVQVFIKGVPAECLELEEYLASEFELASCTVAPHIYDDEDVGADPHTQFTAVGAAAARYLYSMMEASGPTLIGVGKGRSLAAMVDSLPQMKRPDLQFVSVSGSLTRNLSANPYDVVHRLVEKTGGEGYFLPVPYITSSREEKELMLAQKSIQDMLAKARAAEIYIVGIGSVGENTHVRQVGMINDQEMLSLKAAKAVGDMMGSFVDAMGKPVDTELNKHTLGLKLSDVRGHKVIAVAGGGDKGEAVLASLRTGAITDLFVGEKTAQTVRELITSALKKENVV